MGIKNFFWQIPRMPFLYLIILYQKTLSPDHSWLRNFFPNGYCKFYPSCSMYGYMAIKNYGVVRGIPKALYRVARCNPFSKGGIDMP